MKLAPGILSFILTAPTIQTPLLQRVTLYAAFLLAEMFPAAIHSHHTDGRLLTKEEYLVEYDRQMAYVRRFARCDEAVHGQPWFHVSDGARIYFKGENVTRFDPFVGSAREAVPFLDLKVLLRNPRRDDAFFRSAIAQYAQEEEVRDQLAVIRAGKEPALRLPVGMFTPLLERFRAAKSWLEKAADRELAKVRAWAAHVKSTFFERLVRGAAILRYAFSNPQEWVDEALAGIRHLREPELKSYLEGMSMRDLPEKLAWQCSAKIVRSAIKKLDKIDRAWSAYATARTESEMETHSTNVAAIAAALRNGSSCKDVLRNIERVVEECERYGFEHTNRRIDARFGNRSARDTEREWLPSTAARACGFDFAFKDQDAFVVECRGRGGAPLRVPSIEIQYYSHIEDDTRAFSEATARGVDRLAYVPRREERIEIRMENAIWSGIDQTVGVKIDEDGSARVSGCFIPHLEFLERLNQDFDHTVRTARAGRECPFCGEGGEAAASSDKKRSCKCAEKFSLPKAEGGSASGLTSAKRKADDDAGSNTEKRPRTDGAPSSRALLTLDFGPEGMLELRDPVWNSSSIMQAYLSAVGEDEDIVVPAHEIGGEVWSFQWWNALVGAVEDGRKPRNGAEVAGMLRLVLFLAGEGNGIATKAFGSPDGALDIVANMIDAHLSRDELRAAFETPPPKA
ncbi:hypothetical protein DFJ74DRAFT_710237 [Hyaloraphidium curvatum]|nr:hypothetical protein DFJ74DRAFT_710237 [Hyaloraphidium curvatum]